MEAIGEDYQNIDFVGNSRCNYLGLLLYGKLHC